MALSSTESELYTSHEAAKNARFICSMLNHLGHEISKPTPIHEDNIATIAVNNNESATKRLRHVDLRHFAIMQWVQNGDIVLKHTPTSDNLSHGLTKPLGRQLHYHH